MGQTIYGSWKAGWALDNHTTSSVLLPNGQFDNTYSRMGYLLNRLKYHQEFNHLYEIIHAVASFLKTRLVTPYLSVIVPTPASKYRELQPVYEISRGVANILQIPFDPNYVTKNKNTSELKSIEDQATRQNMLKGAFSVDNRYQGKKILIIDDLFRSGSTLNELSNTMINHGNVENVYVVTVTKTRANR